MAAKSLCSIPDCDKSAISRNGYCGAHYMRWKRHGDPLKGGTTRGAAREFLEYALTYEGDDCLLWPFWRNNMGYGMVSLPGSYEGSGRRMEYAHRRVCIEAHGEPEDPSFEAAHSCGRGSSGCITKRHLSWKTRIDNQADRIEHGTHVRGSRVGNSKLTESDVAEIRALKGKMYQRDIAARFGVSQSLISVIQSNQRWGWL